VPPQTKSQTKQQAKPQPKNYTAQEIISRRHVLWDQYQDIAKDRAFTESIADYICTQEGASVRKQIAQFPELLIEMIFVIVDKDKRTVPFFLNDVQHSFIDDLNRAKEDYRAGRRLHLKFLVLKGRQQGFTSVITAYQLAAAIVTRNFSGFTLADSGENTTTIFEDKAKFPYNNLPEQVKPTEKYNTRRELHFEKINSRWRASTAGTKEVGRSKTLNFFHGSESGFWPYGIESIMTGLGEALTKDAVIILESTANGPNEYKDIWDGAIQGKNNYEAKFYEWWRSPEYRLSFESDQAKEDFLRKITDKEFPPDRERDIFTEIRMLKARGLDVQQLYWYYHKWRDKKDKVKQEYPNTPEQAFQSGDSIAFPEFSKEIHVCSPFKIPDHWYRWRSCDNGYDDPFSWYWFTVSEDGQVFIYREFTRTREDPRILYTEQAKRVKELSTYSVIERGREIVEEETLLYTAAGKDAWNTHHRDEKGKTLIDYYHEGGVYGFVPAVTDRRLRKAVWHEYLSPYMDGNTDRWTSKVQIFDTCKELIRTLPQLVKDEKDAEKVADSKIDNQYDGASYGLVSYHVGQSDSEETAAKNRNDFDKDFDEEDETAGSGFYAM